MASKTQRTNTKIYAQIIISVVLGYTMDKNTTFFIDLLCSNKANFFNTKGVDEYFFKNVLSRIEKNEFPTRRAQSRNALARHVV